MKSVNIKTKFRDATGVYIQGMLRKNIFNYFLSDENYYIEKGSNLWNVPLPCDRKQFAEKSKQDITSRITYGNYFCAVTSFLGKNDFEIIVKAASESLKCNIKDSDIEQINIFLEKHGKFYHPARLQVKLSENILTFALNCAISEPGLNCINREYKILKKLGHNFSLPYIPEIYESGSVYIKEPAVKMIILMGEWFEGFNEFHISKKKRDRIIVWDQKKGDFFLSPEEALQLYTQASMILTCYYNIETFEQIFPWHHAAGDFILKKEEEKLLLRLITVRQYAPMLENIDTSCQDTENMLDALFLFFLNLSIRMRLDRLDGVGEIAWANNIAVKGVLNGVMEGLALKSVSGFTRPVNICFMEYLLKLSKKDLLDILQFVADSYNHRSPELGIIKNSINEHGDTLYAAINSLLK